MAGLDPAIHVFRLADARAWMRGSSPRMTINDCFSTARHSLDTRI
jgi:hypothetical protein